VKRDKLFAQYLKFPTNGKLALEIKLLDDDIARSVEKSDGRKQHAREGPDNPMPPQPC
jgi:hypothetical protein